MSITLVRDVIKLPPCPETGIARQTLSKETRIMKIYTPDGRIVKRTVGFCCDYSYSAVKEESQKTDSLVDLIGSNETYWSETEERFLDRSKKVGDSF